MPQFIPALQRTRNFFELYQYLCGQSEVPSIYHFWGSVSLLAAVAGDKYWIEKFRGRKLYPNLFVMLVGDGGLGKGEAISQAAQLAEQSPITMPTYRGKATDASLIDCLGKVEKDEYGRKSIVDPRLWLIMDELKNDLGTNVALVEAFLALMTELYTATNYTINTSTRKYGKIDISRAVLNWFAGTTESDLRGILTKKLVDSGFTARCCFIFGEYDFDKRYPEIIYPPDWAEVLDHLKMRIALLRATEGIKLEMTSETKALHADWYRQRPAPEEKSLSSIWRRQDDHVWKFAMLNTLAEGGPLVINSRHFKRALAMANTVYLSMGKLLEVAHETLDTKPSNDVEKYIKKKKTVDHSTALRYFRTKKGMDAKRFRNAMYTLAQEGSVRVDRGPKGGMVYTWIA